MPPHHPHTSKTCTFQRWRAEPGRCTSGGWWPSLLCQAAQVSRLVHWSCGGRWIFTPRNPIKKNQTVHSMVVYRLIFIDVLFLRYPRWLSIHIAVLVVKTHLPEQSWEQRWKISSCFKLIWVVRLSSSSGCGTVCFSRGHAVCLLVERVNPWMALGTGEPREKKTALLSLKYWLFNRDPYFIVYEIIPT